jgi:thiosulfate dehydrogenase (quinone) large subunit
MIGLLGIGVALILGVFMNLAAGAGALMLILMWSAVLPPANNLFIDDHIIYALTLGLLALLNAGRCLGLDDMWQRTSIVRRSRILR